MAEQTSDQAAREMVDAFNRRDLDEPVTMSGRTTDVARRQPDGTWRWVIDAPFGVG